ncbi:ABC transporter permease [Desulfosarcina ovata subsp. sediminis]|uniref:ABC transporter permease n=1 Tax=Desulfosarcina ovata subsp. sediminis TaxID=885957 RepID=A0A5K7ZRR1_9BACT|nr:ABC transporter permease [Desulfosarcina ovata subsp. sediminis]
MIAPVSVDNSFPHLLGRSWLLASLLAGVLLATICLSAGMGYLRIAWIDVLRVVGGSLTGNPALTRGLDELTRTIVMDVRLPRILTAAVVGGGLALCGVVFQGILLNPLADPYTLGVSAGAAFGAALALLLNLSVAGIYSVPVCAFIGATATLVLVIYLSSSAGGANANNLILSGIIVAAILSAGISFLKFVADEQVSVIIFWLMGSFASKTWHDVGLTSAFLIPGLTVFLFFARDLNLLCLGRRAASSLGVDARRVPWILLVTASLVTAACVAASGIIGFVGLLVPHMMRALVGPDNRRLLPLSFFSGAILLLAADTVTRAVLPHEIPIGVLTALIGGPFFCYLFRKRQTGRGGF